MERGEPGGRPTVKLALFPAAINAGADGIVGTRPSLLGRIEIYPGKAIFHDLPFGTQRTLVIAAGKALSSAGGFTLGFSNRAAGNQAEGILKRLRNLRAHSVRPSVSKAQQEFFAWLSAGFRFDAALYRSHGFVDWTAGISSPLRI